MPRATTSGSARVAQRMRVLAHLAAFPDVTISQVARDLGVARSTVRNIQQQWGVEALLTGDVGQHSGGGRPAAKPRRWKRCAFSTILSRSLCSLSFLRRQLGRLCHQHPFNSARWLAVEMVKWEHLVNSSRPSGARYVNPTPLRAITIRKYLKAMGISSCRCQPVSVGAYSRHCERGAYCRHCT